MGLLIAAPAALADGGERAAGDPAPVTPALGFSPSRLIVEWANGADRADRVSARAEAEVSSMRELGDPLFQLVRLGPGQDLGDALASLRGNPQVQAASRDGFSSLNSIPDDPLFGQLWGLQNLGGGVGGFAGAVLGADVNAPLAWDREDGSAAIVIADIDSGYRFDAPDLGPVAWANPGETANGVDDDGNGIVDDLHGADFVGPSADPVSLPSDGDPTDDNLISGGHGVHTAGTMGAAGDNGVGITGVAQDVRIMPLRVCANSANEGDEARCPSSSQIAAINYAGANGAKAANMSLGGTGFNSTVRDAFAHNPQTLFVISAGNDSEDNEDVPHYPCGYEPASSGIGGAIDNVICVAATDQADGLAGFSDWGASSVDLGAPGTETLSTYPVALAPVDDDFETDDFSSTWEATGGTGLGRAGAGDGPLTSFGMSDSPEVAPAPSSVHNITLTTGAAIPAGAGACTLSAMRFRRADAGSSFFYQVLSDGSSAFINSAKTDTPGSKMAAFHTTPIKGLGGHAVKVSFGYTAGPAPTSANGLWLDDVKLTCYAPLPTPPGYAFLQGTSMAAPHVTGAAGLLFSLKPSASVTEVREALLSGVDVVPSLVGKTVSGGRLDLVKAMDVLQGAPVDHDPPAAPVLSSTSPASPANAEHARIIGSAEAGSNVGIHLGASCKGAAVGSGTAAELGSPGIVVSVAAGTTSQFSARATDAAGNASSCSNSIAFTNSTPIVVIGPGKVFVDPLGEPLPSSGAPGATIAPPTLPSCKVPRLSGKTLAQAKRALAGAGCRVGKITKPKARRGQGAPALVVKSSSPAAGSLAPGDVVGLTLGPKPKQHRH